jgi:hypothetical protein
MELKSRILLFKPRLVAFLSLCVITPLGFILWSCYEGPYRAWIRFYITGIIYEIFWSLVVFLFWPQRKNITKIVTAVFLMTCFLEFLQLWEQAFLETFRRTYFGSALIGTCFVWGQFPYYIVGCLISWLWLYLLSKESPLD